MPEPKEDPEKLAEHLEQTVHAPAAQPEPEKSEPKPKSKMPKWAWITIAVLALIVAVVFGYVLATHKSSTDKTATTTTTTPASTTPTTSTPKTQPYVVYVKSTVGLNFRSSKDSSSSSNILVVMPFNAQPMVTDDTDSTWYQGTYNGQTGYFDKSHTVKNAADVTADWKTNSNTKFGYAFKYPADWKLVSDDSAGPTDNNTEVQDSAGKMRVTFWSVYGRGCGGPSTSYVPQQKEYTLGTFTVMAKEFSCGVKSDDFYFYADTASKVDIEVDAYADAYDSVERTILKSATGFVKAYQK